MKSEAMTRRTGSARGDSPPPAVALRDARVVRGGRTTLEIGELAVPHGELAAVVGPNGSGKSTLLRVINGLIPLDRGEVSVLGERLDRRAALAIRRRCALVFQDPLLLHGTVFDNVALALRFRGTSRASVNDRAHSALRAFRCEHLSSRLAHRLSAGEVRRVCLARAWVCTPELMMLDEPFTALDSPTRSALVRELRDIALERGTTVLLVTHDFDDVLSFASRAIVLRDGRILQDGSPEHVLRRPVDAAVARLVSMDNILCCEAEPEQGGTRVRLPNGAAFLVPGAPRTGVTTCCLAGDAVALRRAAPGPAWVSMEGRVVHRVASVGMHRVTVDCGGTEIVARLASQHASSLVDGERILAAFEPSHAHLV